jgi:3-oxoacyl-[acyl-carrier protein] reductase
MDLGLDGKRAAVAAASAGLGLASAKALAAEGVRVAICGRDRARIEAAAGDIGTGCVPLVVDVSDAAGGAAFVAAANEALGGVDILVTNAGGPPPGTFASTAVEAYPEAIDLNLMSVVAMVKAAAPAMVDAGWGRIVAITSIAVRQPIATMLLSNTARAGVTGFLKTVALELKENGVTVNSLQPGLHRTGRMTQLYGSDADSMRMGEPGDFGGIVAFVCSDQAKFLTGAQINVDGGSYQALQ